MSKKSISFSRKVKNVKTHVLVENSKLIAILFVLLTLVILGGVLLACGFPTFERFAFHLVYLLLDVQCYLAEHQRNLLSL